MEIKKWTIMFEGQPAKAEVFYRDGHGWDMKIEGIDPSQNQTKPGLTREKAIDLLIHGYGRNCWDIADEQLKANPPDRLPVDPKLLKAIEEKVNDAIIKYSMTYKEINNVR